ncbi:MAG: T9SS response regulator signal transducer PorX [Luteibaculaceae bacterium]
MQTKILWADDEIDLLKPHIMFLEQKGYSIESATNGTDALDLSKKNHYDLVILDENMPGISGLETLTQIKDAKPHLPVIMITKSEEESIMEDAIGSKISDYLIKPVNPNQILSTLRRILDKNKLVTEKTTNKYSQQFNKISMDLNFGLDFNEWTELYKRLVRFDIELQNSGDPNMIEVFNNQLSEADRVFGNFIENNYEDWVNAKQPSEDVPLMSHTLFNNRVAPLLRGTENESVFLIVIDNLRYDQWKIIEPQLERYFRVENESIFYSILPTATQYARNALFAGMMPLDIARKHKNLWVGEDEEGGKNNFESELLEVNLKNLGLSSVKFSYNKITNLNAGKKLVEQVASLSQNKLNVIVYNFVDMLSHARSEMEVIKELAENEAAYRSITNSWFEHSPLFEMIKIIAQKKGRLLITTDHGTRRVKTPSKVIGDRNTNTNLRYKTGKNLQFESRDVYLTRDPEKLKLPKTNVSSSFIFAKDDKYFVYQNNYNQFVQLYKDTFQHGGISLEEILIPFIDLRVK